MDRTLVLNADYQPLTIVSAERGLTLLMKDKVDLVASNGRVIHSQTEEFHVPSVVTLRYFVKVPFKHGSPQPSRKAIFARDKGLCQYCDRRAENLDHVVPRARGGQHVWENLVAACKRCNGRKADKTLEQSGLKLRKQPVEPRGSKFFAFGRPEEEWLPYLA